MAFIDVLIVQFKIWCLVLDQHGVCVPGAGSHRAWRHRRRGQSKYFSHRQIFFHPPRSCRWRSPGRGTGACWTRRPSCGTRRSTSAAAAAAPRPCRAPRHRWRTGEGWKQFSSETHYFVFIFLKYVFEWSLQDLCWPDIGTICLYKSNEDPINFLIDR